MEPHPPRESSSPPLLLVSLAAAAYVLWFVLYFSETNFYGVGLSYLLNLDGVTGAEYLRRFVLHGRFYPPFYYAFVYAAFQVAGFRYLWILAANALFPLAGAMYLYLAGRRLAGPLAGALAGVAFLLVPATTVFSKTLLIEAPLVLLVPALLFHGLASDRFERTGHAVLAGLALGLALLTKWSALAYALPLALVLAAGVFFGPDLRPHVPTRRQVRNLALALAAAAVVAAPWYLLSFSPELFRQSAKNDPTFPVYSPWSNLRFNLIQLRLHARTAFLALAGLSLAGALSWGRRGAAILGWLVILVVLPFLLFCLPGHLEDRYLWPIFPGLALVLGLAFHEATRPIARPALRWAVTALAVAALVAASYENLVHERGSDERTALSRNYGEGTLLWERADADRVLLAVAGCVDRVGFRARPVRVAAHPFMQSPHLGTNHLRYHRLRLIDRLEQMEIMRTMHYRYPALSAAIRAGEVDFLLVDAGWWVHYRDPAFDPTGDVLGNVLARPYVDQSTGKYHPPLSLADFRSDLDFIEQHFRLVRTLELAKSTVWVLASDRFEAEAGEIPAD